MINNHGPVMDADRHFREIGVERRLLGQGFDTARQVISEIADGAAGEGQVCMRRIGVHRQMAAQQIERVGGRTLDYARPADFGDAAARHQGNERPRGQDIEAADASATAGARMTAIEKDRPGFIGDRLEQLGAIGAVREASQAHAERSPRQAA